VAGPPGAPTPDFGPRPNLETPVLDPGDAGPFYGGPKPRFLARERTGWMAGYIDRDKTMKNEESKDI